MRTPQIPAAWSPHGAETGAARLERIQAERLATFAQGDVAYDYDRQAWLRFDGAGWHVEDDGHPRPVAGCFACEHLGEVLPAASVTLNYGTER